MPFARFVSPNTSFLCSGLARRAANSFAAARSATRVALRVSLASVALASMSLAGLGQTTAPATAVGSTSATLSVTVTITTAGTAGAAPNVLTQGAANKDFRYVGGGTCGQGSVYAVNATCTVLYNFTPTRPGQRLGAVSLTDATGNTLGNVFLNGNGTGPLAIFPQNARVTSLSGGGSPVSFAVDGNGNVFVADEQTTVKEIVATNGIVSASSAVVQVGSGFSRVDGVAVDGSGNVYVADSVGRLVRKIVAVNGAVSANSVVVTVGSGFGFPYDLAVDGNGDVFVVDSMKVKEIVAANGVVSSTSTVNTVGTGFGSPEGIAVDGNGNVFVSDGSNNSVKEIVAVGGMVSSSSATNIVATGFSNPLGVAVDAAGDIFLADNGNGAIKEIVAVGGVVSTNSTILTLATGYRSPVAVALDGNGHLYVSDNSSSINQLYDFTVPPTLSFPSEAVATSSPVQTVSLQNEGNAALTFSAISSSSNFTSTGTTCSTSTALAQSGICSVSVNFSPVQPGALTGFLNLTDNSLNVIGSGQGLPLSGTATASTGTTAQTITFTQPATPATAGTTVTLAATSTSGLTILYTVVSGPATVSGSSLTYQGPGTVLVQASQYGNATYAAATSVQRTVAVTAPGATVGATSATQTAIVQITTAGTLGATPNVLTQGAVNKDFKYVSGGTCSVGTAYALGATCTVLYTFTPSRPGQRLGAVSLTNSAGTAVLATTYLNGIGTGPLAVLPGSQLPIAVGSGYSIPYDVKGDGNGDLFIADYGVVKEVIAVNGVVSTSSTVVTIPVPNSYSLTSIAVDGSGNVFCTNGQSLYEIVAVNGAVSASSSVITINAAANAYGLAIDGSGNIFFANVNNSSVNEIVAVNGQIASNSAIVTVGSGFNQPIYVAVDRSGNVFVSDTANRNVKEIVAVNGVVSSTSTVTTLVTNVYPQGISVDAAENVFFTNNGSGAITELVAVNGVVSSTSATLQIGGMLSYQPYGLFADGLGHIFVADTGASSNLVKEFDLTTGPTLAYPNTSVGATSATMTATVQNAGNSALTLSGLGTTGNFTSNGTTCSTGTALAQSAVCVVGATFTPQTEGALTGTFNITDNTLNVGGKVQTVSLSGTGTAATPTTATVSAINSPFGSTTSITVTATESGSAGAVTGGLVTFAIVSPATGTVSPTTCNLSSGGTCTTTYTPTGTQAVGTYNGGITASFAANNSYNAANASAALNITQAAQTINFTQPTTPVTYGAAPVTLVAAGGGSGNAVTFSIVSGSTFGTLSGTNNSTLTFTGAGTIVIAANQAGSTNYAAATAVQRTVVVNQASQTITFTAPASPVALGSAAVTLSAAGGASGNPVTFSIVSGGTSGTLSGTNNSTLTFTSAGTIVLAANQAASTNYAAATAVQQTVVVNKGNTSLSLSPMTVTYGSAVTLSTSLTFSSSAVPAGTVNFTINGGANIAATCTGTTSPLTCTYAVPQGQLPAGTTNVGANFAGDANYNSSSATGTTVTINKQTPTVTDTNQSITYGPSTATLTASLSYTGNGNAPTGTFSFSIDGGSPVTATCTGNSSPLTCNYTVTTSSLTTGTAHNVAATYVGDGNYAAASASTVTFTINKQTPSLAANGSSIVYGASSNTLTATLTFTGTGTVPSGAVTFSINGGAFTAAATCAGSGSPQTCTLTYSTAGLAVGSYNLVAKFAGDSNYATITSSTNTFSVTQQASSVTASAPSIVYGTANDTLTASVTYTGSGTAPTGGIKFSVDGGSALAATCSGSSSPLTCTYSLATGTLAVGSHNVSATLASDANYSAVTSSTATLTVTQQTPTVTLTAPAITYGTSSDLLTASIAFTGSAIPSGAVTFTVAGGSALTASCTGTASPRTCTYSYPSGSLAVGSYTVTASEAADMNYAQVSATPGSLVVSSGSDTITLTSTAGSTGDTVTLTATLSGVPSNFSSGTMTFSANSTTICTVAVVNASGSCTSPTLMTGTNSFTVVFSGGGNYAGSNDTATPLVITVDPPSNMGTGSTPPGGTSAPIPVTISFGSAFTLGSIGLTNFGANGNAFTIVSGGTCATNAGAAYTANTSCTVDVTFTNVAPGLLSGSIIFTDQNGNAVASVPVATLGVR